LFEKIQPRISALTLLLPVIFVPAANSQTIGGRNNIQHVLLISIDGMHAVDYMNCANGIAGVNGGAPYCPSLAALGKTGVNYVNTSTSRPSDSFPGLMALVTGGSPRSVGAYYDVAYDRSLNPPAKNTGNGIAAGTSPLAIRTSLAIPGSLEVAPASWGHFTVTLSNGMTM
jgi:hypothetical protein